MKKAREGGLLTGPEAVAATREAGLLLGRRLCVGLGRSLRSFFSHSGRTSTSDWHDYRWKITESDETSFQ